MEVYRKRAKIRQDVLAVRVGVSQPRICNIELVNDPTPPQALLEKIKEEISFPGPVEELQSLYEAGKYDPQTKSA